MSESSTFRGRQSAVRIFAQEYSESSLIERGVGEYDPSFVITKLGAKVNRCLVCGGLERMERRDGDSGPFYRGQVRDPLGDSLLRCSTIPARIASRRRRALARFESGDSVLVSIVGRQKSNESEDGGIFTSLRAENFTEVGLDDYKSWMVDTADATLRRLEAYDSSQGEELSEESMRKAGVPEDLVDGLIKSKEHYAEFDTEAYRVWILKALSRALGSSEEDLDTDLEPVGIEAAPVEQIEVQSTGGEDPRDVILGILGSNGGELVEYEDLVGACISARILKEGCGECSYGSER